jgi:uncharacterized protein
LDVFNGIHATVQDQRQDYGEQRFITIGHTMERMVVIVWTPRINSRLIISMRKANDREQKAYASFFPYG